eukprot:scaffold428386_cov42-Prasinocladus_malaysianus.AAC.1
MDGAEVAIKVLSEGTSLQGETEYDNEVAILASLRHPHVVQIYARCDESKALVMELMKGGSLHDALKADRLP